jgi:dihydrofolate synthase/folylpolyglutamate synthase
MKPNNSIKLGLDNSLALYKLLNNPVDDIPIIHIGGTNGKGSIALKISECLKNSGLKTGLFVSPHISSFRERAQINGNLLTENDVMILLPEILKLCDDNCIPASFFEISTILALLKFKRENCDVIVLEVGLGGRLDSTNIINSSVLSIITSVQLDHCKVLGFTTDEIAKVKAGIMKHNVDVLVGPHCPIELLKTEAKLTSSPFYTITDLLQPQELKYDSDSFDAGI